MNGPKLLGRLTPGGIVVALVGFGLTRTIVLDAIGPTPNGAGGVAGELPALVVGLGLSAYGVALAVSTHDRRYGRRVAGWCLGGTAAMAVIVGGVAVANGAAVTDPLVTSALIAGAVGGTLVGVRTAAAERRRRALAGERARQTALDRLVRHVVLNKVNVISGYADAMARREVATADGGTATRRDPAGAIRRNADRIAEAVERIGILVADETPGAVPLPDAVEDAVETVRADNPEATVAVEDVADVAVRAPSRLDAVVAEIVENAVVHGGPNAVRVAGGADDATGWIRVEDDGPGLPDRQRDLLEGGGLPEYDDPGTGFGLSLVRIVLDDVGGAASVEASDDGTVVTLTFERADVTDEPGVTTRRLVGASAAALVAGVGMGAVLQALTGGVAVVGTLYESNRLAVGWATHLFHSVVFGMGFAALLSHTRLRRVRGDVPRSVAVGVGYGVALWVVAASLVMPLWLRAVGYPSPVPRFVPTMLLGHVVWGALVGGLVGYLDRES